MSRLTNRPHGDKVGCGHCRSAQADQRHVADCWYTRARLGKRSPKGVNINSPLLIQKHTQRGAPRASNSIHVLTKFHICSAVSYAETTTLKHNRYNQIDLSSRVELGIFRSSKSLFYSNKEPSYLLKKRRRSKPYKVILRRILLYILLLRRSRTSQPTQEDFQKKKEAKF